MIYKIKDYRIKGNIIEFDDRQIFIDIDTLILKDKTLIYRSEDDLPYDTVTEAELTQMLKNNVDKPSMQDQVDELTILLADVIGGAI